MPDTHDEFWTARQAGEVLGYSSRTLADARARNKLRLRAYRITPTGALRFRKADVLALLELEPEPLAGHG